MSLSLSELADGYMDAVRYEQGCTRQTCYTYRSWLNVYLRWLETNAHPNSLESLSPALLRTYAYSLSQRGLRPRTVRSAYLPVKGLCTHLVKHGVLAAMPTDGITLPKKDPARRDIVSAEEVSTLASAAQRLYPPRLRFLADAMISTLTQSGVRFTEWIDLRVGDVDQAAGTIHVRRGKGLKARTLYPPPLCMASVAAWVKEREAMGCRHDYLWAADRARRMGAAGSRALLEQVKAAAGLADRANIKPHALRHAFASRMLTNGANLKVIQAALGHSDIKTTATYLHINELEAAKMSVYAAITPAEPPAPPEDVRQTRSDYNRRRRSSK